MKLTCSYPLLLTENLSNSKEFYTKNFNYQVFFANDWYVSLAQAGDPANQLAFIDCSHESIPQDFRQKTTGIVLNFEVADIETEYERLISLGVEIVSPLKDEAWGQRHFICLDHVNKIIIDVIKEIEASKEYESYYQAA